MKIYYQFQLDVYKTTRDSWGTGGNDILTKNFQSLEEVLDWRDRWLNRLDNNIDTTDINEWFDDNDFPAIMQIDNCRICKITIEEL